MARLLEFYVFITRLNAAIGDECEVSISATSYRALCVRVDWPKHNLHALREFSYETMRSIVSDRVLVNQFVMYCRDQLKRKLEK